MPASIQAGLLIVLALWALAPGQVPGRRVTVSIDMRDPLRAGWFDPKHDVVGLRGDTNPLSWTATLRATDVDRDGIFDATFTLIAADDEQRAVEFKVKVDGVDNPNDGWESGENRRLTAGQTALAIAPSFKARKSTVVGRLERHPRFASRFVRARDVAVLLPPGYAQNPRRRYPVLYLHDGQNLFDGSRAFKPGLEWRVDEAVARLVGAGVVEPMIVVGIDNASDRRIHDYTPVPHPRYGGGGARAYGRFLLEELMPFVDRFYRTKRAAADTALGGSSLGGLVSLSIGLAHPDAFGRLLVASPSVWWADEAILADVRALPGPTGQRIWVDIGTGEGEEAVVGARRLRDALIAKGWREGEDLRYVEAPGAIHDEGAWAQRLPEMLKFLFPRGR